MNTLQKTGLGVLLLAALAGTGCGAERTGGDAGEEVTATVVAPFRSELSPLQKQQAEILYRVVGDAKEEVDSILAQTSLHHEGYHEEDEVAAERALMAASSRLAKATVYATRLQEILAGRRSPAEFGNDFALTCCMTAAAQRDVAAARSAALSPPLPPPPPPPTLAAFGPEIGAVATVLEGLRGPPPTGACCP